MEHKWEEVGSRHSSGKLPGEKGLQSVENARGFRTVHRLRGYRLGEEPSRSDGANSWSGPGPSSGVEEFSRGGKVDPISGAWRESHRQEEKNLS